jgi:hypothetical protein
LVPSKYQNRGVAGAVARGSELEAHGLVVVGQQLDVPHLEAGRGARAVDRDRGGREVDVAAVVIDAP